MLAWTVSDKICFSHVLQVLQPVPSKKHQPSLGVGEVPKIWRLLFKKADFKAKSKWNRTSFNASAMKITIISKSLSRLRVCPHQVSPTKYIPGHSQAQNLAFYVNLVMKNIPLSPTGLKVMKQKGLGPCLFIWWFSVALSCSRGWLEAALAAAALPFIPGHTSQHRAPGSTVITATKLPKLPFRVPQEQVQLISQPGKC